MLTLKEIIKEIILQNDFIEDGLYNNYINLSSFGEYIKPIIEKKLQKEVTLNSIKMALSRISKDIYKQREIKVISKNNFFIKKNITIKTIQRNSENLEKIQNIYQKNIDLVDNYLSIVSGSKEINVIYSDGISQIFDEILFGINCLELKNLGAIGIYLDDKMLQTKGMFYSLCKTLAFNDINILEITSTYKEIVFFIKENDLKKSIEVLII